MIGPQEMFDKTKTIEDMQKQDLTIPREPGGGTGTRVSTKRRSKTEDRRPKTEDRRPKNEELR